MGHAGRAVAPALGPTVGCLGGAPDEIRRLRHGDLVRRDGDLELDLLADEPPALLEGDIPVESPVLARDRGPGRQARVASTAHAGDDALELDVERERIRRAADRQVAGHPEPVVTDLL